MKVKIKLLKSWMSQPIGSVIEVHGVEADLLCERGVATRASESKAHNAPPENKAISGPPESKGKRGK